MNLLPRLLDIKVDSQLRAAHYELAFRGGIRPGWVVLCALVLGILVVWRYRRSAPHLSPFMRYFMAGLRTLFLALVIILFLRPVLAVTIERGIRRTVVFLCDATRSMRIEDPRTELDDLKRAAIAMGALDPAKGLDQPLSKQDASRFAAVRRTDLVYAILKNNRMALLKDKQATLLERLASEYAIHAFSFGAALTDLGQGQASATRPAGGDPQSGAVSYDWVGSIPSDSPVTPLGDAVSEVIRRKRGQPLAGIVIMTDGGNNAGSDPLAVARIAEQEGVPLYTYGVGISSPKDIIVANIFAPEVCFARDEAPVNVRVRCQNLKGEKAMLQLKLTPTDPSGKPPTKQPDSKEVIFDEDGEQVIPMTFTPDLPGEFDLEAWIDPRPDETVKENNYFTHHLRVVDGKIKVLLVEQSPRWEFKYLQQQLLRDRRVDLKCVLLEADAGVVKAPASPYLPQFPKTREEMYKFDLIILGDVDPKGLAAEQISWISEFVARFGGGFLMVAGKNHAPADYLKTDIAKMLPVEFDSVPLPPAPGYGSDINDKPIRLEMTADGQRTAMLRLSDKEQESLERWKNLPPIYWDYRVARPKPAAQVLLVDPDPLKGSRFGKMPVVAIQQYGLGQVMWMGTDNTWRWRKNKGDVYYITLWGQMIQRLSLPHLLGAAKQTQLTSDKQQYIGGQDITVYARLYTERYEPITQPTVHGIYQNTTAADITARVEHDMQLRPLPDQPGMYRGSFKALTSGAYKFHVGPPGDPQTILEFTVTEPKLEFGQTAMNEALLRQMAQISGGRFFREENLAQLPEALRLKSDTVRSTMEVELWASPLYFLFMLGVVTLEWILRKLRQLK